ncbi:MAG: hypothetical protein KBI04_07495 [Paludibacteraceae bacterium]|nr:hypothetical protein [Paludibacteraceae bacterium]
MNISPSIEDIAGCIARRDSAITIPIDIIKLNKLVLSVQEPMNLFIQLTVLGAYYSHG